jgi:electron transfer flavoprotein beta subunit
MTVAACIKWVTGIDDDRFAAISPADAAAVEWALRCGEQWGDDVVVVTAGPPSAEAALRNARAVGAARVVRVDLPIEADSATVAAEMSSTLEGCRVVWCGDYSSDRGSGSVPAYLAAHLGAEQALGIVGVDIGRESLQLVRRLDGGRRERLTTRGPAVVSVEGSTARLRRAPLRATLGSTDAPTEVQAAHLVGEIVAPPLRPYRPRARALAAPAGDTALDRLRVLTDSTSSTGRGETLELDPESAADRILAALREWGEHPG